MSAAPPEAPPPPDGHSTGATSDPPPTAADFVADKRPSAFLKLTMSRRVKDETIAASALVPFVLQLLQPVAASRATAAPIDTHAPSASAVVRRVLYGRGSRRTVLLELKDVATATRVRALLQATPCALLGQRPVYVEFAMLRTAQEARDRLERVCNVQRDDDGRPGRRVPGLRLASEFISSAEEAACVAYFDRDDKVHWATTVRARQVQHFGYAFKYDTRRCDPAKPMAEPIPLVLQPIVAKIAACGIMDGETPDQITVNEYLPGQGIAFHTDTHSAFTTTIATLSIASQVVMDFRCPASNRNEGVVLPARSMAVMSAASRYEWEHAIVPRLFDVIDGQQVARQRRLSITFRKVRSGPCECPFPTQCDTPTREGQDQQAQRTRTNGPASLAPTALEQQYVHEFYETVAAHFSSTRHSPWPKVGQFVASLPRGSMIADVGCGNGKYMKCVDPLQSFVVGGDRSSRLVDICRGRGLEAIVCDALAVPLRSNSCDAALSIAVLHHLSTLDHRLAAVKELLRIVRVNGQAIIYAWAHEQMKGSRRRFDEGRQDFMVPWNLDKRFARTARAEPNGTTNAEAVETSGEAVGIETRTRTEDNDTMNGNGIDRNIVAKQQDRVVQRYCHMFKQGELESLVELAGNAQVQSSYYDESNWAVVIRRVR